MTSMKMQYELQTHCSESNIRPMGAAQSHCEVYTGHYKLCTGLCELIYIWCIMVMSGYEQCTDNSMHLQYGLGRDSP